MRAYKCDRCEKLYDEKTIIRKSNSVYALCEQRTYDMNYIPIDLCPDCMMELSEWLKMEEKEHDNTTSES